MPSRLTASALVTLLVAACAAPPPSATAGPVVASPGPVAASVPAPPPPPPSPPPPPPPTATDVLTKGRAAFDACYRIARAAHPALQNTTVEMEFTLNDDGTVLAVDLNYKNRMGDAAKECMRSAALALRFPDSLRGKQVGTISFSP